ncbi:hypothetical protein [Nocardia sp. CNY236]|nr:hypothetical protein [Nocardia sp. CNY236]
MSPFSSAVAAILRSGRGRWAYGREESAEVLEGEAVIRAHEILER